MPAPPLLFIRREQEIYVTQTPRLPLPQCLAWGVGTLGISIIFNTINVTFIRFATDYLGMAAALVVTLFSLSKLFDAAIDPAIGILSDRTRSRLGRRRPWLYAGSILCAGGFAALYLVPASGVAPALFLYAFGYAVFNVPYMAMPAEMTSDYHDRSRLVSFRVQAIGIGTIMGLSGAPVLIAMAGGGVEGHRTMALAFGLISAAAMLACAHFTQNSEASEPATITIPFKTRVQIALGNRPFLILLAVKALQLGANAASQMVLIYFFLSVLGRDYNFLGLYGLVASLAILGSTYVWLRVSRVHGKRLTYMVASILFAITSASWFFVDAESPTSAILIRAILGGIASGGLLLMGQAMLPDAISWDMIRSGGLRREGLFAGFYTTAEKLSSAIGLAAVGAALSAAGYVPSTTGSAIQPASAIEAIRLSFSIIPAAMVLLSALVLLGYDLDRRLMKDTAHEPQ